jgi:ribonuclease P protein component
MIKLLFMTGRKYRASNLSVYADKTIAGIPDKYAAVFVVPSVSGNAPERNRMKRWLREDFRKLQGELPLDGAFVIRFNGQVEQIRHDIITGQLEKLHKSILVDD